MTTNLVPNRKILTILRTATDFLTQAFIDMAVSLIRSVTTVLFIVTDLYLRNAFAIFANEKRTVARLFWKK